MKKILFYPVRILLVFIFIINFNSYTANAEEIDSVLQQLEILQNDIKTLEKAVYSQDVKSSNSDLATSNGDTDSGHLITFLLYFASIMAATNLETPTP